MCGQTVFNQALGPHVLNDYAGAEPLLAIHRLSQERFPSWCSGPCGCAGRAKVHALTVPVPRISLFFAPPDCTITARSSDSHEYVVSPQQYMQTAWHRHAGAIVTFWHRGMHAGTRRRSHCGGRRSAARTGR